MSDSLVIHRGARTIVVKHPGRGNTAGDLVVYLPQERILATGDLVVRPIPFAFYSYLSAWPQTLRALTRIDAATVLPGHGELMQDWSYVHRLIALIESTWDQARRAIATGADVDAVKRAVNVDEHREWFGGREVAARFDALFLGPAVEAVYDELRRRP